MKRPSNTVDLQRELILVAESSTALPKTAIATALNTLRREGDKHLKLRSQITGTGKISGRNLELALTIPLDTRYKARNEKNAGNFNMAWANALKKSLNLIAGGYVSEVTPTPVTRTVTIETTATNEEIETLIGGLGRVLN